jgi:hypothetical protein
MYVILHENLFGDALAVVHGQTNMDKLTGIFCQLLVENAQKKSLFFVDIPH